MEGREIVNEKYGEAARRVIEGRDCQPIVVRKPHVAMAPPQQFHRACQA